MLETKEAFDGLHFGTLVAYLKLSARTKSPEIEVSVNWSATLQRS